VPSRIEALPRIGVGAIYVPGLEPLLQGVAGLLDLVEIEPQTMWRRLEDGHYALDDARLAWLAGLPGQKVLHGVGFPVGGSRPPDPRHLAALRETWRRLDPPWMSEHLSFNRASHDGMLVDTGFLLPPRQTPAGAAAAVAAIKGVAAALPFPFLVENGVNYLAPRPDELNDGRFLATVLESADCGLLLDLHNAWANQLNGRQSVAALLAELPLERVAEVHLAGGLRHRGFWLDAHSGAVAEPLWPILMELLPRLPNLKALVFEIMPGHLETVSLDVIRADLERMRALFDGHRDPTRSRPAASTDASRATPPAENGGVADDGAPVPEEWEDTLGALVAGREIDSTLGRELAADPGLGVLRELVAEFRASTIVGVLPYTGRLMLAGLGVQETEALFSEFWRTHAPEAFGAREAEAFARFLDSARPALPALAEILAFDLAVLRALTRGERSEVHFAHEPLALLTAIADHRTPAEGRAGTFVARVSLAGVEFAEPDGRRRSPQEA
jgi:uncharacterized protein (UPF0276 family)